jgi:hypothetical protein
LLLLLLLRRRRRRRLILLLRPVASPLAAIVAQTEAAEGGYRRRLIELDAHAEAVALSDGGCVLPLPLPLLCWWQRLHLRLS